MWPTPMLPSLGRCAALLLLALPLCTAAQGPDPLGWEDCVRVARQSNPALKAARESLAAAHSGALNSYNGLMPSVTLSDSYSKSGGESAGFLTPATYRAQATASVDLFRFADYAAIETARAQERQAEAGLRSASAQVRSGLRQAFVQLIFAQEDEKVSREILDIQRQNSRKVDLQYDAGSQSKGNMMQARAQVAQAEAQLAQSLLAEASARQELARQLGVDAYATLSATGTWTLDGLPPAPDLPALVEASPQVAAQRASLEQAEAAVDQAKSVLLPTLNASYSQTLQGTSIISTGEHWSLGATLSLPIFGSGPTSAYYAISSAKSSAQSSRDALTALRRQLASQIQSVWAALANAFDQVKVQTLLREAALQTNAESQVRYSSGLMTFQEWQIVVGQVVSAEHGLVQTELSAGVNEAQWAQAIGKPLGE